jgi:hypothetical protein
MSLARVLAVVVVVVVVLAVVVVAVVVPCHPLNLHAYFPLKFVENLLLVFVVVPGDL